MKLKTFISTVIVFFSVATSYAQMGIDSLGNAYVGNCASFPHVPSGLSQTAGGDIGLGSNNYWTEVTEGKLNLGGLLSIAAEAGSYAFTVSAPYILSSPSSALPFFTIAQDQTVYSKNGILQSSDSILKENITLLPSTLGRIRSLKGVTFNYKGDSVPNASNRSGLSGVNQQREEENHRKRIGLLAQDVEQVYPEAVRTLEDGTKAIYYSDLVAVLVEGVKELEDSIEIMTQRYDALQARLDSIQQQITALQASVYSEQGSSRQNAAKPSNVNTPVPMHESAVLYQNSPNPFDQETEITYRLGSDVTEAMICIYDLNGRQVKQYRLPVDSVSGRLQISARELTPGMYIYALLIDGRMIDSKRMILNG